MKSLLGLFRIDVETVTCSRYPDPWAQFLDVQVGFGKRWHCTGHFDVQPFRKVTSIWSPQQQPQRPPHVDTSKLASAVPSSLLQEGFRCCQFKVLLGVIHGDFEAAAPEHVAIPAMREFISSSRPVGQYLITNKGIRAHSASWLVIPYNVLWAKSGLASALREIHAKSTKIFEK